MVQGNGLNLLGPTHCRGEHLSEKTGSIIKLPSSPKDITAVECPIHVYVILFLSMGNVGLVTGNY